MNINEIGILSILRFYGDKTVLVINRFPDSEEHLTGNRLADIFEKEYIGRAGVPAEDKSEQ